MKFVVSIAVAGAIALPIAAQETKPVPKNSIRVSIPGCTKGYIFTAGRRTVDEPGTVSVPEGMHLRMNGPKKMMTDIKAHEGSMIEITGLMKKGQYEQNGVAIGGGVRVAPGGMPNGGVSGPGNPGAGQNQIDVEGWRPITGECPVK
jgi:hypothetical protein